MKNIRVDVEGRQRCWNCGGMGFTEKRTARSKVLVGVGTFLTKKKLKCQACGEYNDTGSAEPYTGPADEKKAAKLGTAAVPGVSAGQVEVVLTGTSLGVLAATNALVRILSRHKIRTSGGAVQAIRGGTSTAVARLQLDEATELVAELKQAGFLVAPLPVAAATAPSAAPDVMGQLRQLGELRDAGVLTSEEFETKKADLLARM